MILAKKYHARLISLLDSYTETRTTEIDWPLKAMHLVEIAEYPSERTTLTIAGSIVAELIK